MRAFEANFQKTKIKSNQREVNLTWLWLRLSNARKCSRMLSNDYIVCLRVKKSSLHFKWVEVKSPPYIVHFVVFLVSLDVKNCWSNMSRILLADLANAHFITPLL